MGDNFSTVEVVQCSGGLASVLWGITSVLWRLFSTVGISRNLQIFSRAYFASQTDRSHRRSQVLSTADMVKDLGYNNLKSVSKVLSPKL